MTAVAAAAAAVRACEARLVHCVAVCASVQKQPDNIQVTEESGPVKGRASVEDPILAAGYLARALAGSKG